MEKLLKGASFMSTLLFLLSIVACSNSSTSNNNQNNETKQPNTLVNAISKEKSDCNRPLTVSISNADYQDKGNYQLTYSWNSVDNATGYEFELLVNGTSAFQSLAVTDTFITFNQPLTATDTFNASVKTVCGTTKSPSAKISPAIVYNNAISVDDIVFLVTPTTTVGNICEKSCEKLKFTSNSLLNSDGSLITLNSFAMQVRYYDFNAIKNCIECTAAGTAPVVNPAAFNSCLENPLNQYWLYDPGAFTICP